MRNKPSPWINPVLKKMMYSRDGFILKNTTVDWENYNQTLLYGHPLIYTLDTSLLWTDSFVPSERKPLTFSLN